MHDDSLDKVIHSLLNFNDNLNPKLVDVASPLTEVFDSTYFYYIKYFTTIKRRLILSTRSDCLKHFLTEKQVSVMNPMFQNVIEEVFTQNRKYYLWTGSPTDTTHQAFFEQDIWNGCTLYVKTNDIIEACGIATKRENEKIVNKYVKNLDMFPRFMLYFKENLSNFINEPDKNILLPSNLLLTVPTSSNNDEFNNFINKTQINNYPIFDGSRTILITKREAEVIFYLSQGKSAKEIAIRLSISPRTVESYVENIKLKLHCMTKSKAIDLFLKCYGHNDDILFIRR